VEIRVRREVMSTVLIVVIGLAGLACPLHMWRSRRRGRTGCMAPQQGADAESVRVGQRHEHAITELGASGAVEEPSRRA